MITDIAIDNDVVAPGQTFEIEVSTDDAGDVAIDGIRGARQLLQAPLTPGHHEITVLAGSDGSQTETRSVTINVEDRRPFPLLSVHRDPYSAMTAALRVNLADAEATPTSYLWQIGEKEVPSNDAALVHDFAGFVDHTLLYTNVDVHLTAFDEAKDLFKIGRTITVWSWYQLIRQTGVIQSPVTCSGIAAPAGNASLLGVQVVTGDLTYSGSFVVENIEPETITFTSRQFEWLSNDPDSLAIPPPAEPYSVTIAPNGSTTVEVVVDRKTAPKDADGFTVHLFGQSGEGDGRVPAHATATFEFGRRRYRDRLPGLGSIHFTQPDIARVLENGSVSALEIDERSRWLGELSRSVRSAGGTGTVANRDIPVLIAERSSVSDGGNIPVSKKTFDGSTRSWRRIGERIGDGSPIEEVLSKTDGSSTLGGGISRIEGRARLDEGISKLGEHVRLDEGISKIGEKTKLDDVSIGARYELRTLPSSVSALTSEFRSDAVKISGTVWDNVIPIPALQFGQIAEGQACDPDDLPDDVPQNMACQFTGNYERRWLPGRIVNAKKGDIILSPGGNGLIGGLLKQVDPPQRYSHTGIMTRNYYELAHSTASDGWLEDHPNGSVLGTPTPTDGFEPNALKYLWPGGIIQTAEEAFGGSEFTDPSGKKYSLSGFGREDWAQFGDRWELIPAMVIKPHPSTETEDVRRSLHKVANQARAWSVTGADTAAGKQSSLHYRFYCYSDAAIAVRKDPDTGQPVGLAPPGQTWPGGTTPTVCSSMVWLASRQFGFRLEGPNEVVAISDLESDDVLRGAQVDGETLDGLYLYTAQERLKAAEWLKGYLSAKITKQVMKEGGDVGGAIVGMLTDIADDCSNQILNTFALDWADTDAKDSEEWRNVVDGHAVSPDNLMFYDHPHDGYGLWGYAVPLLYRAGRFEDVPVTQWKQTSGPGTLTGLIRAAGAPVPYAEVKVGGRSTFTGIDGRFSMEVDEGRYAVSATHQASYGLLEGRSDVKVVFRETTDITIDLADPPAVYRELVIAGTADGNDDEGLLEDDEEFHDGVSLGPYPLGPYGTHASFGWRRGWGGECRAEFDFNADWQHDNSITVQVAGRLYEGTSETTDDLDGTTSANWRIAPDETQYLELFVRNDDEDENTWCRLVLRVTNRVAP